MSQVLEQPERRHHRRKGWWLFAALALLLVAAGVRLAGDHGGSSQVLGAGAGKSTPAPSGPTEVLGASESRPGLVAPTVIDGPAEGSTGQPATAQFTYSHPVNGVNFACSLDNAPFARCPKNGISYQGLGAGPHFFAVAAQQGNGPLSPPASRSWTVGTPSVPVPSPPVITVGPPGSTIEPDATFIFTHEDQVSFECRRDSEPFEGCTSPKTYEDLTVGSHVFFVRAVGANDTRSPVAQHPWTIVTAGFGIEGSLKAEQLLAPGAPGTPLNLVFTNPYSNAKGINITELSITVDDLTMRDDEPNPDCIGSQHVVVDVGSAWKINVPRNDTVSLEDLEIDAADWPQVKMLNLTNTNQDACKNTTFTFTYSGTAAK
jgi:hypothetical protein